MKYNCYVKAENIQGPRLSIQSEKKVYVHISYIYLLQKQSESF